jgi:hypothetical protein
MRWKLRAEEEEVEEEDVLRECSRAGRSGITAGRKISRTDRGAGELGRFGLEAMPTSTG